MKHIEVIRQSQQILFYFYQRLDVFYDMFRPTWSSSGKYTLFAKYFVGNYQHRVLQKELICTVIGHLT